MTVQSKQDFLAFPAQLHWSAQDLADAVPLRLFELFAFDPADAMPSANRGAAPCARRPSYAPAAFPPSLFRVHG
jgi:hypothetical protein